MSALTHRLRYALGTRLVRLAVWLMQPAPARTNEVSVHDVVAKSWRDLAPLMAERKALGLAKYGTLLQYSNGRDHLLDAEQEAADLLCYLVAEWQWDSARVGLHRAVLFAVYALREIQAVRGDEVKL